MEKRARAKGRTRQRIAAAVLELLLEGGPERVTIARVAARAKVAVGTLYQHFRSRDRLLAQSWDGLSRTGTPFESWLARRYPPREGVRRLVDAVFRSFERNPETIAASLRLVRRGYPSFDEAVAQVRRRRLSSIHEIVRAAKRRGELALASRDAVLLLYSLTSFASWRAAIVEIGLSPRLLRGQVTALLESLLFTAQVAARRRAAG